jgi:hypothetical protein
MATNYVIAEDYFDSTSLISITRIIYLRNYSNKQGCSKFKNIYSCQRNCSAHLLFRRFIRLVLVEMPCNLLPTGLTGFDGILAVDWKPSVGRTRLLMTR